MDFDIRQRGSANTDKYKKDELDIAYDYSKQVYTEAKSFIKAIVLFGSAARNDKNQDDVDILVILDDVRIILTDGLVQTFNIINNKIVEKVSPRLHITMMKLTAFWEYVRAGDPIAVNILRDGVPLVDTGFFEPVQLLLLQGRIRPSNEAIFNYFEMAPRTLANSRKHLLNATVDLYWAVIDSAHAALMRFGSVPPSPSHVADIMQEKLVLSGKIDAKYARTMRNFYKLAKMIAHNELRDMTGEHYEEYYREANDFVETMKKLVKG